jgi:hypothetical protein
MWQEPAIPPDKADFSKAANHSKPPEAPYVFLNEELTGSSPKILIRDASDRIWEVKGGYEGRAEAFITRFISASGYYADSVWFLERGHVEGVRWPLKRAQGFVAPDGSFTYASFELRDSQAVFLRNPGWTWMNNPFSNTSELRGLKLLVMLFSNWDNKDGRDRGSNVGVLRFETAGVSKDVYYITDWGQSFGSWGTWFGFGRSNWNCQDYTRETRDFVNTDRSGRPVFGFRGQHGTEFVGDIGREDIRWLLDRIGGISDAQIRTGFDASGASASEKDCFTRALRERIERLKRAAVP